jgi:uncharacterized protein
METQLINQRDSQGRKQGPWEEPGFSGEYTAYGIYKDDLRQGLWQKYRGDDTLWQELHYVDDILQGVGREYYPNENIRSIFTFKKGMLHGPFKKYWPDGITPWEEGQFKDGLLEGLWKYYHHDGTLRKSTFYIKDIPHEQANILVFLNLI